MQLMVGIMGQHLPQRNKKGKEIASIMYLEPTCIEEKRLIVLINKTTLFGG